MESFERKVVFRTARGYFFLLAVLAVLAFLGGIALGTKGLIKVPIAPPAEPVYPPEPPAPPSITKETLDRWLADREKAKAAAQSQNNGSMDPVRLFQDTADRPKDSGEAARRASQAAEIDKLFAALRELFPAPQYSWADESETYCAVPSPFGGCMRNERRLIREGVVRFFSHQLESKNREDSLAALRTWTTFLPLFPVETRLKWAVDLLDAFEEIEQGHRQEVADWREAVDRIKAEHQDRLAAHRAEVAEQEARRERERTWGLYGVGGGLVLLVLVSIFLVHFAIERHLRLMREVAGLLREGAHLPPDGTN